MGHSVSSLPRAVRGSENLLTRTAGLPSPLLGECAGGEHKRSLKAAARSDASSVHG